MPQAVTHVLIALIIGSFIRDYFIRDKKKFPLHYVLILGLAALLPDLDIAVFWILYLVKGISLSEVHRTFTHTLFFSAIFFLASLATLKLKNHELGRHRLKIHAILWIIGLGILLHLGLDAVVAGQIRPFYPLSDFAIGNNIVYGLTPQLVSIFWSCLDAALLVLWLIYVEWKHKISDFL